QALSGLTWAGTTTRLSPELAACLVGAAARDLRRRREHLGAEMGAQRDLVRHARGPVFDVSGGEERQESPLELLDQLAVALILVGGGLGHQDHVLPLRLHR